ncbi:hypothetical protein LU604_06845 [Erwinia tracheiphila]|uniref:hypothetical protein n=1 Tax=Erwinia tracheiphila TaxID=65700 RepID=UPI001F247942|nr:hypothetical protein [Erwinia tracheiphila]UIA84653.1 hypothetical protein LU604_06845 [Erwinia tracheiphila]
MIENEEEAEGVYREERVKYEKAILLGQVYVTKKRERVKVYNINLIITLVV